MITPRPRPLAAVSLKTYLGQAATLEWVHRVRDAAGPHLGEVDLLVLPMATALVQTVALLGDHAVTVGAQDCSWSEPGAFTGELPASVLHEIGARAVEIGHAERRRLFGDGEDVVARKTGAAVRAGLVPLLCVGEEALLPPAEARSVCTAQVDSALADVPDDTVVIVAYEPLWAIGADEPAPPAHIRAVCSGLRDHVRRRNPESRVLYGGTAGPGLFGAVHPDVDGLFLGRRAHDVGALVRVLDEMAATRTTPDDRPATTRRSR